MMSPINMAYVAMRVAMLGAVLAVPDVRECSIAVYSADGGRQSATVVVGAGDDDAAVGKLAGGERSDCAGVLSGALEAHAGGDAVMSLFYESGDPHRIAFGVGESAAAAAMFATRTRSMRGMTYCNAVSGRGWRPCAIVPVNF